MCTTRCLCFARLVYALFSTKNFLFNLFFYWFTKDFWLCTWLVNYFFVCTWRYGNYNMLHPTCVMLAYEEANFAHNLGKGKVCFPFWRTKPFPVPGRITCSGFMCCHPCHKTDTSSLRQPPRAPPGSLAYLLLITITGVYYQNTWFANNLSDRMEEFLLIWEGRDMILKFALPGEHTLRDKACYAKRFLSAERGPKRDTVVWLKI